MQVSRRVRGRQGQTPKDHLRPTRRTHPFHRRLARQLFDDDHIDDTCAALEGGFGPDPAEQDRPGAARERGLIRICTVTRLEIGYSARSATDHRTLVSEPPVASMPVEFLTPRIEDRALELQSTLAQRGQHRAPSIPDLLIAATAELAELTVLHVDKDFELIADVTGQPVERIDLT